MCVTTAAALLSLQQDLRSMSAALLSMRAAVAAAVPAVGGGSQAPDPRRLSPQCWLVRRLPAQIIRRADMSLSVVRPPERRPANNSSATMAASCDCKEQQQQQQPYPRAVHCEIPGGRKISEDALTLKGGRP